MKPYRVLTDDILAGDIALSDPAIVDMLKQTAETYGHTPEGFLAVVLWKLLQEKE